MFTDMRGFTTRTSAETRARLKETVDQFPAYYNYGNLRDRIAQELPRLGAK